MVRRGPGIERNASSGRYPHRASPAAAALLAIEEPELTVHPGALELIHDYVRQAAADSQVLLTTHSPDLLDLLNTDAARVVERVEGATMVSRLSPSQRQAVREGLLSLGEVFRAEGLQPELPLAGE